MTEICNAKITDTMLGMNHGIMTCYLTLEFAGGGCAFGGYALDTYSKEKQMRVGSGIGLGAIMQILKCVGVEQWEDLKGRYIRIEHTGWGGKITKIGNLIKDDWFSFDEFFKR